MTGTLEIPHFDVDRLRQIADMYPSPPADPVVLDRQWRQLVADLLAAADHIETLEYARKAGA